MPGIVTHNRIFKDSIAYLSKRKKKSYLLKSIQALFSTDEFIHAGLFGAFGPNIFDYIPQRNTKNYYGHELSFFLHNGAIDTFIPEMIKKIYAYTDKNNEWAATQRAYLYGFIAHVVTDSIFHPFVFYYSGFPEVFNKKEIYYYREQNLLFQYNIDNYYLYYDDNAGNLNFNLDAMFPVKKNKKFNPAVKALVHETLDALYPDIYKKMIFIQGKEENKYNYDYGYLDLLPWLIKISYWIKINAKERVANVLSDIRRRNILYSDFIVQYPRNKKIVQDALNFHRGKWNYPSGKTGMNYDSIEDLRLKSCDKIVSVWEKVEESLYNNENTRVFEEFKINAYTGDDSAGYYQMSIKEPFRLHF